MAKKKKSEEHENHERWLVSYADFITLLFAFFVVMYSISQVREEKLKAVAESMNEAFDTSSLAKIDPQVVKNLPTTIAPNLQLYQKIQKALEEAKELEGKVQAEMDKRGVVIRVADTLLFDTGKAEIRPEAKEVLSKVGGILADLNRPVKVEGHTDNEPIKTAHYPSNWELSTDRASVIVRYFIDVSKMEPSRLSTSGYAEFRPIGSNSTPEGRAKNRRVDIVVLSEHEATQEPGS